LYGDNIPARGRPGLPGGIAATLPHSEAHYTGVFLPRNIDAPYACLTQRLQAAEIEISRRGPMTLKPFLR
jgi:hypothetical protein